MNGLKKTLSIFLLWFSLAPIYATYSPPELNKNPLVAMDIVVEPASNAPQTQARILISLHPQEAPISTRNFLNYVEDHYYDGTIFHRMIPNFMIQGGGFTPGMKQKASSAPISNEASAKIPNIKGSIAMARSMEIDSATSQFFINFRDNHFLDHIDETGQGFGYAVFGQIVSGLTWLENLQQLATHQVEQYGDVPSRQIIIKRVHTLTGDEKKKAIASIASTPSMHQPLDQ